MKVIDLTTVSRHVELDRQDRFNLINNTVGFGLPVVEARDKQDETCTATLTSTGVIVIINAHGVIVTVWIASVRQAIAVYATATGTTRLPKNLWNIINYNNDTELWHKIAA